MLFTTRVLYLFYENCAKGPFKDFLILKGTFVAQRIILWNKVEKKEQEQKQKT